MLIAAHPDDESLACSIVLQRAIRAGASVRVVYATDGENNPWPQRAIERKWRLHETDRERWGKLRRQEALAALGVLGVNATSVSFLGLPDQKLTELLISGCRRPLERLSAIIANWAATDLLVPSVSDTHPDHNALGVMLRLISIEHFSKRRPISIWSYVVHGKSSAFFDRAATIRQTTTEAGAKWRAISCHKSQLKLSRRRFFDHAARPERLLKLSRRETTGADGAFSSISRQPHSLSIILDRSPKPMRPKKPALFILGHDGVGTLRCARMRVPLRSSRVEIFNQFNDEPFAVGQYSGGAFAGELVFPVDVFSANRALFVKLERRGWFFDEAGWLELPATAYSESVVPEEFAAEQRRVLADRIDNIMALQQTS